MDTQELKDKLVADARLIVESAARGGDSYKVKSIATLLEESPISQVDNFDGDTVERWRLTALAKGVGCLTQKDMPPSGIRLEYFMAHIVEMVRENTGEIIEPTRVVLIDVDGKAYGYVSATMVNELDTVVQLFGLGPWKEGIPIIVTKGTSRKGRQIYSISPA